MKRMAFFLFCFVWTAGWAASIGTDPRTPLSYSWQTYTWVLTLSLWGGLVAHIRKYAEGKAPENRMSTFIVDVAGSGLAGLLAFFGCEYMNIDGPGAVLAVGVSGHMGVKALFALEKRVMLMWARLTGTPPPPP